MDNISWFPDYRSVLKLLELEHACGEYHYVAINQVTFKRQPRGWRCFLKGTRDGMAVIAFLRQKTYRDLLLHVSDMLETDAIYWHPDKYP